MIALKVAVPVLLSLFVFFPVILSAQETEAPYSLIMDEEVPSPGKEIVVRIRGEGERTSSIRSVRWYVDGQERPSFANKLQIREVVGNRQKTVVANITYSIRGGIRRYSNASVHINPITFDLLWEGASVTTPLYKGYPLAGPEVPIQIYAEIQYINENGIIYTEDDFSFVWEIETKFHEDTGPGVSSILYEKGGSLINNSIFALARATLINNQDIRFQKSITIPIVEPRIILYPYTITRGLITERAIPADVLIQKQPLTVSLYPFYFSARDFTNPRSINYTWDINNGQNTIRQGRRVDISLQGENTIIPVQISAQNKERQQQQAETTLRVSL